MSDRSFKLAAFALTGLCQLFLGRHSARRHRRDGPELGGTILARLGLRALFVGFTASLLNAAMAGLLLKP